MPRSRLAGGLLVAMLLASYRCVAVDVEDLKKQVQQIRDEIAHQDDPKLSPVSKVDDRIFTTYGPYDAVTTRKGALNVGGLVQVWYQYIQNDKIGIVRPTPFNNLDPTPGAGAVPGTPIPEPNDVRDNDTFRVRRTELRFYLDLTENISSYVMIDPSREANLTFSPFPANPDHNHIFNNVNLRTGLGQENTVRNSIVPQVLQDGFIVFHDIVPHHEFQIGQFKPPSGEEAWRGSGLLDFVDRSMVTAINNVRDIGVMAHGGWYLKDKGDLDSGRLQYWFGVFNGPNGTVLTDPEIVEGGNRTDDNNDKDICWRILAQPIWSTKKWTGRLEVGTARTDGFRGSSGNQFDPSKAINAINRQRVAIDRMAAWLWYRPGGPVIGWWFRGEWGSGHDFDNSAGFTDLLGLGSGPGGAPINPMPVSASGYYISTGYKLSQSIYAKDMDKGLFCKALKNSEFTFRYEEYANIALENLAAPDRKTNLFSTKAWTLGYNYYIDAYRARLQANYVIVDDPNEPRSGLHEVKNNMFVLNYQVQF
ncbi:MAG TPA: hypothetical protein VKX17_06800 [Planctomycetota bacterium]|nr:hypothetical protein [Planctomycetota bacterium]